MKLGTMLADCALRYPAREAVVCGARRLTFRELDERANRLANALLARGQALGDRIALYLPNGAELVEAMCALAKSGGVIVPISTRLSAAEVQHIFEDSEPWAIFFTPAYRAVAYEAAARLADPVMVAVGPPEPGEIAMEVLIEGGAPAPPPRLPVDFDDLIIAYTSGTTGTPKGAISTHQNIIIVHAYQNAVEWQLRPDDRVLATTPMAHRTGLGRIANAVCLGSAVVIMERFDPAAAVDLIERERITVIGLVPTIARMLLPEVEKRPEACRTLQKMVATGETFPVDIKQRYFAALPALQLYSFYAQTESGFISCLRPEEQTTHPESVGRPVSGVEIRIVDGEMKDVPVGEPGEVLFRCGRPGELCAMRGYYRRPEETREAFVEDGWLRTGDICRMDADGYLYFVDRLKDMIVSGGLNIYSKEVELALARHPAVAEAAVFGMPDPQFGEAVMACVELEPGHSATEDELIAHCRALIASYKKPRHVRFVPSLPRTSTGKVMKKELREAARADAVGGNS